MTATEVLRRLLDEQGFEWREHEAPATDCIAFFDGNGWHDCWESVDGEVNVTFSMTPEQAIAATLGSCNCSDNCTNGERTGTYRKVYLVETSDELIESWFPFGLYLHREAAEDCAEALRREDDGILCFARVSELKVVDA